MATKEFDIGPTPKFVEGGCLCGKLRYRVTFPENHDFGANVSQSTHSFTYRSQEGS